MAVSQSLTLTQSSQSVEDNHSKVRVLWQSTQTEGSYNNYNRTAKYYVSINGGAEVEYSVKYTLPKKSTATILDITLTVAHNSDGTGSIKVRTWMDTDISAGVVTQTKSLTLATIPRATTPTFNVSSVDMGGEVTIYLSRASSSFTHDLAYSFAGGDYVSIATGASTVHYWGVPDLASKIPNAVSGTVTIRCITKSGGTTIGTKTATLTIKVPQTADFMPKVSSVSITEANSNMIASLANAGLFVKLQSKLNVSITCAGAKGSTIKSCVTTVDGLKYSDTSFVTPELTSSGTVTLTTTVKDSRGRTTVKYTSITVWDYHLPVITSLSVYRVDANDIAKTDGEYMHVTYSYEVASVNNKNTCDASLYNKAPGSNVWGLMQVSNALKNTYDGKQTATFSTDNQYEIRLTVEDIFGAKAERIVVLPTAKVILDIRGAGDGIAFGKVSEWPGFELDMEGSANSFKLMGVRSHEIGDGYGHILYNNGLLLQWGSVSVTPTAVNTTTSLNVKFTNTYKAHPHITATLLSNSPHAVDWSLGVTDAGAGSFFTIYMIRTTMHAAPFRWMAIGLAN